MLLGAKNAAWLEIFGKSHQLKDIDPILESQNPTLISFNINSKEFAIEETGSNVFYVGHVWTIFQVNPDRFLMITSYLLKQDPVVIKVKKCPLMTLNTRMLFVMKLPPTGLSIYLRPSV